jgi:ribosomal-protein-alanine N-acetyltransferase
LTRQIPTLETRRLVLRPWNPNDAEAWFGILQEEGILRYFPDPRPPTRDKADRYIAHHLAHWEEHGYGHWAVVTPTDTRVVGWTGLEYLPELRQTEVSYLLSKTVWGHGFASEAAQAAIRFGFEAADLEAIIGLVHQDNIASISVLEKCGLRLIDRIGLWGMDMCRYGIHRAESPGRAASWRGQASLR